MQRELAALLERPVDLAPKDGLKPVGRQDVLANTEIIYAESRLPRRKTNVV